MVLRTVAFIFIFTVIFGVSFGVLAAFDLVPETSDQAVTQESPIEAPTQIPELPIRVVSEKTELDVEIVNPTSTDIDELDKVILKNAARYPTSARLGEDGTVILFAHSTSIPIVNNQAYKIFNPIKKLNPGDIVSVYSGTTEYRYSVTDRGVVNSNLDAVQMRTDGKYLVLITTNTGGEKDTKVQVNAKFIGSFQN